MNRDCFGNRDVIPGRSQSITVPDVPDLVHDGQVADAHVDPLAVRQMVAVLGVEGRQHLHGGLVEGLEDRCRHVSEPHGQLGVDGDEVAVVHFQTH